MSDRLRKAAQRVVEYLDAYNRMARALRPMWPSVEIEELRAALAEKPCWCHKCNPALSLRQMIVCPGCGNKRCPRASSHELACTGSNEVGQLGSNYGPWVCACGANLYLDSAGQPCSKSEKPVPLTEEQITDMWVEMYRDAQGWGMSGSCKIFSDGLRAGERAHGIGGSDDR